jgi:putative redox protein
MSKRIAVVRQLKGLTFAAKSDSNHWVMMDATEELGGENAGSRPKELILMALGGCTGSDVASILAKKRIPVESLQLNLSANTREQHPQIFTDIHIEYVFHGDGIAPADLERAIELSTTKYCSVSAMLRPTVKLTHSYRIEPAAGGRNP